jgi:2-keto-3-deoxy-L-rhamnonate aldolase RhmA
MQPGNRYANALAAGRQALGVFCCLDGSSVAHVFASAGFDFVVIDKQHATFTWPDLESLCFRVRSTSAGVFVRTASFDAPELDLALDLPVDGVVVPNVSSLDDARLACARCKYPPHGTRSIGNERHEATFGVSHEPEPLVGLLVESVGAVDAIDPILELGVDFVWVGLHDLAGSMGLDPVAGDPRRGIPEPVRVAVEKVRRAARAHATAFWGIAGMHEDAAAVIAGVDARLVRRTAEETVASFRRGTLRQLPG